ncbi:MAG: HAD-IC family P-type ATPase, partial [Venatoribacter sp.]
ALGLAAPAAITRALGVLAKRNVLVVKPDALETLNQVSLAVFDKTGTLTEPVLNSEQTDPKILQLAASLARESQHPLSRALVAANHLPLLAVTQVKTTVGMGLEGTVAGRNLRLGQARFALNEQQAASQSDASLVLGENGQLLASFNMDEKLRNDAVLSLNQLANEGIGCTIVSGDSEPRVKKIAQQLGLSSWHSRQLPADKLSFIKAHHDKQECVLVVGDGSNDAPVLAGADVSVALTSGAELAQANADVLLCDGKLGNLLYTRSIAKETQKILRQNERWAVTYNTLAMPAAALGFIPPWLAAIFMSLSSLFVVLNALRIGRKK